MILNFNIEFGKDTKFIIPKNYRITIMHMIKTALEQTNINYLQENWNKEKNNLKDFTFSTYVNQLKHIKNTYNISGTGYINVKLSCINMITISNIYNALLNLSNYNFHGNNISIKFNSFNENINVNSNKIAAKTLSPIIIREIKNKKSTGNYLTLNDNGFEEQLYYTISNLCKAVIGKTFSFPKQKFSIKFNNGKEVYVSHYKENIKCTTGSFTVEAPKEVLNVILNCGLGARRSQGFGMISLGGV